MPAQFNAKFAESDAYISELMREVRAMPEDGAFPMGRRTFFKLAGAGTAGLVLGFHLPSDAFAAEAPQDGNDQAMNAFIRIAPDNTITIYSKCAGDRPGHQDLLRPDHRRGTGCRLEPCRGGAGGHQSEDLWQPGRGRFHLHPARLGSAAPGRRRRQGDAGRRRRQEMERQCRRRSPPRIPC